jgi:glycosyltransferase involved in cell wall biosynthesis
MSSLSCTVVIPTRNRPAELQRCLAALKQLDYPNFDLLVVDNAPSDARSRDIAQQHDVGYVREDTPGLSRARNRGAAAATGEIVAYLDDDAVAEPGWLSALAREFQDAKVMAATGRVQALEDDGAPTPGRARPGGAEFGGPERLLISREMPDWFRLANFGGVGIGMNMAFRRSVFDEWSGFDERLGRGSPLPGCEEHRAFFDVIKRGYRVAYTPQALVCHPVPATAAALREKYFQTLTASGAYIALLFTEEPHYRGSLLRSLAGGMRKLVLRGGKAAEQSALDRPSRRRILRAYLSGVRLYAAWRRQERRSAPGRRRPA